MSNKKGVAPLLAAAGGAVILGVTYLATRKKGEKQPLSAVKQQEGESTKKAHADPTPVADVPAKEEIFVKEPEPTVPMEFSRAVFLDQGGWLTAGDDDEAVAVEQRIKEVCAALECAEGVVLQALSRMDELGSRAPLAVEAAVHRLTLRTAIGCDVPQEARILASFIEFFGSASIVHKKEHLTPFAAFLVADGLLRRGKNKELAMQLLGFCVSTTDTAGTLESTAPDTGCFSSLPRLPIPFYIPHALLDVASLIEEGFTVGLPEEYAEIHARQASLKPIIRAIQLTRGDNQKTWQALGTSVDRRGVEVLGRHISPAEAFAEAIRCAGGIDGCNDPQMWLELALCLQYDLRLQEQTSTVVVPRNGHWAFTSPQQVKGDKIDKKFCLVRCLTIQMEEAQAWLELSGCLAIGNIVEQIVDPSTGAKVTRQQQREEKINIGAMGFTRMDCLALSLALEPDNAEAWYRAALCMEDRVKCEAAARRGVVADRNIFERQILQGTRPFDRVTCLIRAVQCDASDGKYWFALGTTLAEREELMETAHIQEANEDLTLPESIFAIALGTESLSDVHAPVSLSSEKCFAAAKAVNPQFGRVVDQWRQGRSKASGAAPQAESA